MSYHRTFPDPPPSHPPHDAAPYRWDSPTPPQQQARREPHRPHGDLDTLRSGYRKLRRVSTLTALGYFVLFLFLAAFAPGLMTSTVTGGLTTGLLLGLCQLPVALAAIALYERIARHRIDPLAVAIRESTPPPAEEPHAFGGRGGRRADAAGFPGGRDPFQWPGGPAGGDRS
ncbi:DUF485 domain-containing protein [Streptomyces sp. NPDC051310]|uniref:DUF485 domain-containing protein n=1 Tax=Streptomyces sp. NPDC051310 TaxID=3365649 RepID=UPI0037873780